MISEVECQFVIFDLWNDIYQFIAKAKIGLINFISDNPYCAVWSLIPQLPKLHRLLGPKNFKIIHQA